MPVLPCTLYMMSCQEVISALAIPLARTETVIGGVIGWLHAVIYCTHPSLDELKRLPENTQLTAKRPLSEETSMSSLSHATRSEWAKGWLDRSEHALKSKLTRQVKACTKWLARQAPNARNKPSPPNQTFQTRTSPGVGFF